MRIPAHSRQRVCDPHATRATPPHSTREFRVSETRLESGVPPRGTIRRGCNPSQTYAGAGQRIRITRTADDRAYRGDLCRRFWQGWSLTRSWVRLGRHGRPSRASPAYRLTPHQRTQSRRQLARWLCATNRPEQVQQAQYCDELIRSLRRHGQVASAACQGRTPWRS